MEKWKKIYLEFNENKIRAYIWFLLNIANLIFIKDIFGGMEV